MRVILVGHPESQSIVKASKYLVDKYLPGFNVIFLNHTGPIDMWSDYVAQYLMTLGDDIVILALDDYLLSSPLNEDVYYKAVHRLHNEFGVANVKLCPCMPHEHVAYPVTTQYTLWDRTYLIKLLRQTTTPWDFEMRGSSIFKEEGAKALLEPCLDYPVHSALSKRWQGVRLDGLSEEDKKEIKPLL